MALEHVAGISVNYDKQIFERQATCYENVAKFHIWLKEMFSNSICHGLMENSDESAAVLISAVFVTREHDDSPQLFQNRRFWRFK